MTTAAKDIEIFTDHCVFMRSVYLHARTLFETCTTDDKALMASAANTFFGDLSMVLTEYLILQVCKITDPARDFKKNENHTLALMLEHCDLSSDPQTAAQFGRLYDNIQAFSGKLRLARNKLISHSDRLSILASQTLGAATPQEWDQFWLDLQDALCILRQKILGGSPFYLNGVAMLTDADGLLKALRHGAYFDQLLHDSDPVIAAKCIKLALD